MTVSQHGWILSCWKKFQGWNLWKFLPVYTKIFVLIAPKTPFWPDQNGRRVWNRVFFLWYNYHWCCTNDVVEILAFDLHFDLLVDSYCARVCWASVAFWMIITNAKYFVYKKKSRILFEKTKMRFCLGWALSSK